MSDFDRTSARAIPVDRADMSVDTGLRAFMLGVYNKMALGLLVSAGLAFLTAQFAPVRDLLYVVRPDGALAGFTTLGTIVRFSPIAMILVMMFGMRNPSPRSSGLLYWGIVTTIGAGAGVWLLAYTGTSVATTFMITAATFGALSLFGYVTKKDLTGFGSFLIMGLVGVILASIVNMFVHSGPLGFIVSVVGVLIFAGLTAYDTQRLKGIYYQLGGDQARMGVATNFGALNLYLDFINLFQLLLSLFGGRR
jgi:FtsH-binding integral membrane protein